ncbi:hypothetical protein Htur_2124 [Haloterrigena turkmenica DSM 5511]|uniref:Uncharacterized protein n=1 Tax=Haloterrigena turkmenica (strain ATCC 51198 / DSM 5511 / JCM 9101 / NCIMB 13204 / VKM B-1734 / 4k) TaxID=543526 RepID=D2RTQ6_HALTV|nr:hypothetical protein [Haloterrigena turkmenica]ADB61007.1 hypothetical protein Htur_2124 [Haloterrigena turkmenica DSM 5511]
MSVIRQPGVLGRTTRRRVVGVTAAFSTAAVEAVAVGLWFTLVVGSPSASTALAALGILFCGSLLRASVFGATVSDIGDVLCPQRLGVALLLTGSWIVWLLVAQGIGGVGGIAVATVLHTSLLVGQFILEQRAFCFRSSSPTSRAPIASGLLLAVGAAALLASAWFTDWAVATPPLSLEVTTIVLQVDAVQVGVVVFGLMAFLAHQRRFERLLEPCP